MRTFLVAALLLIAAAGDACTTFCTRGLFGRNYDFEIGDGIVVVNKRAMSKESNTTAPAKWSSRFGSVTFNQFGRDNPTGGSSAPSAARRSSATRPMRRSRSPGAGRSGLRALADRA